MTDTSFIKNALKLHQIDPRHKVDLQKKGHGYYHLTLGKAHNTSSWYFDSNIMEKLMERFELNTCAKEDELHITLIRKVK